MRVPTGLRSRHPSATPRPPLGSKGVPFLPQGPTQGNRPEVLGVSAREAHPRVDLIDHRILGLRHGNHLPFLRDPSLYRGGSEKPKEYSPSHGRSFKSGKSTAAVDNASSSYMDYVLGILSMGRMPIQPEKSEGFGR